MGQAEAVGFDEAAAAGMLRKLKAAQKAAPVRGAGAACAGYRQVEGSDAGELERGGAAVGSAQACSAGLSTSA